MPVRRSTKAMLSTLAVALSVTGVAAASVPHSSTGVITGCYNSSGAGSALRIIDAQAGVVCAANEKRLTFNQTGPTGPTGPTGATGATGPQGPPGSPGG